MQQELMKLKESLQMNNREILIRNDFYTIALINNQYVWIELGLIIPASSMEQAEEYVRLNYEGLKDNFVIS